MLRKDKFKWSDANARVEALAKLKVGMSLTPILAMAYFSKPFVIETDARGVGIGDMLLQYDFSKLLLDPLAAPHHYAYDNDLLCYKGRLYIGSNQNC